jgi:L-lysine 2,3-aminomutase
MPTLTFKVTEKEAMEIRRSARGRTVSGYIRHKLFAEPPGVKKKQAVKYICNRPGRVIIDTPPITDEELDRFWEETW